MNVDTIREFEVENSLVLSIVMFSGTLSNNDKYATIKFRTDGRLSTKASPESACATRSDR
jgi:hypothetical protein